MQQMEIQKLSAVTQEHDESANVRDELFVCLFKKAKAKKSRCCIAGRGFSCCRAVEEH